MKLDKCLEAQYQLLANIYEGRQVEICAYDEEGNQMFLGGRSADEGGAKPLICTCTHPEKCTQLQQNLFRMPALKPADLETLKTRHKVEVNAWGSADCPIVCNSYFRITVCHTTNINHQHNGYFMICEDITEEKRNAERLKQSERRKALALEAGHVVPWRYDYAKQELTMLLGNETKVFRLENMKKVVHPDDLEDAVRIIRQIRDGELDHVCKTIRFFSLQHNDYCYFEGRMIADYDDRGHVIGILGTQLNITQETLYRQQLEQYKLHTQLVNERCQIVQWSYNPATRMLHTESRKGTDLGTDMPLQTYLDRYVHPDDHHQYWTYLAGDNYLRHPYTEIHVRMRVEGYDDYRLTVVYSLTHQDPDTGAVRMLGIRQDETERKEQQKLIERNVRRLKHVMRLSNMTPVEWDVKRGLFRLEYPEMQSCMPQTFQRFGEWVDFDFVIDSIHPDEREKVKEYWHEMTQGHRDELKFTLRYDSTHAFRTTYQLHLIVADRDEKTQLPVRVVGYLQDITDHEVLVEKLIEERFKAEEASRLKTAFLANISHEIRTPLNAIVGFSGLLTDPHSQADAEEKVEFSNVLKENSALLLDLVNRVVELSCIEAGKSKRFIEEFSLNELFHITYVSLRMQKKNPAIDFVLDTPAEDTRVRLDRRRMSEVLTNFVGNAFKYTASGTIQMGYRIEGEKLHIFVKDTGCGISEENKSKVFLQFEKLNSFKQGAGLGMSICAAYVEAAKGEIGVDSEVGKGSTFWVNVSL